MKGFTLIELLAVITLLALVTLISTISVANMLKETKNELSKSQIKSIEKATSAWAADNITKLPEGNKCSFLLLKDLKENGLLDSNIIDPDDKETLSNDIKIKITSKLNNKGKSVLSYEVSAANVSNCTYIGSDVYVDLPKGLTPIIYDGENWKVPEINEEWYNYDKQMWANAVVLGKGKIKKPGEIVKVEGDNPDALMMFVYIPRYEYKIEGQYGTHTDGTPGTAETPGEIEVKFINKFQTTADEGYILHPGFVFGDKKLDGIWVGKFELSHKTKTSPNLDCSTTNCTNASGLRILPNVSSLRSNNVSNFWYGIKSIENTQSFGLSNIDTHMMKNSEWGAVAYLSQSKYGKYGNDNYDKQYKEVYQNKSDNYITGSSNGTPSQSDSRSGGQCVYNDMTNLGQDSNGYKMGQCGPGASTTGNIYGVYDMSGGAYEHVMGVYGDSEGIYSGSSSSANSGFEGRTGNDNGNVENGVIAPDIKYYDVYANETNSYTNDGKQSCNNNGVMGICYGHAISETSGWYEDYSAMISLGYPWLVRGGAYDYGISHGIFYYNNTSGSNNSLHSARVVFLEK